LSVFDVKELTRLLSVKGFVGCIRKGEEVGTIPCDWRFGTN